MKLKKILVLEDEIIIARHIQVILEPEGYQVRRTSSFNDFTKAYREDLPDLAIVDINLNTKREGIEVGHWLKKEDQIPFIYLTSYSDRATVAKAAKTRPSSYLLKPFRVKELIHNVSIVINNYNYKELYQPTSKPARQFSDVPYKLKKVINYIEEHVENKITLNQLSALSGWSKPHFIKSFKNYMNISPYQFILEKKMEKAKEMVAHTDLSIKDISAILGFASHSNFNKAFMKFYNTTAQNYRKATHLMS
ncbi:MAG: DNA-binding response regulator [Bacteroidota bacterium]